MLTVVGRPRGVSAFLPDVLRSGRAVFGQIRSATLPPNAATLATTAHCKIADYKPRE
jgi:hypothetical protein